MSTESSPALAALLDACDAADASRAGAALGQAISWGAQNNAYKWLYATVPTFLERLTSPSACLVIALRELHALAPSVRPAASIQQLYGACSDMWCKFREMRRQQLGDAPRGLVGFSDADLAELRALAPLLPVPVWARLVSALALPVPEAERIALVQAELALRRWRDATAAAVHLGVAHRFSLADLCEPLIKQGFVDVAFSAVSARPDQHDAFCRLVIAHAGARETKVALRYIQQCGLDPLAFPDVIFAQRCKVFGWLLHEGKLLEFASAMLPGDRALQERCVRVLSERDEWVLLRRLCRLRGRPRPIIWRADGGDGDASAGSSCINSSSNTALSNAQSGADIDADDALLLPVLDREVVGDALWQRLHGNEFEALEEAAARDEAAREREHLYSHLSETPANGILMVDCMEALAHAKVILASATILGLDSEFGPSFLDVIPSPSPIPTLLQVATRDTCLLFDLPALRRESAATFEACGDVLAAAFGAAHVLKLGYAFAEDLKVLRRAYPEIAPRCFAAVASYVELGDVQVYLHTAGCRDFDRQAYLDSDSPYVFDPARCAQASSSASSLPLASPIRSPLPSRRSAAVKSAQRNQRRLLARQKRASLEAQESTGGGAGDSADAASSATPVTVPPPGAGGASNDSADAANGEALGGGDDGGEEEEDGDEELANPPAVQPTSADSAAAAPSSAVSITAAPVALPSDSPSTPSSASSSLSPSKSTSPLASSPPASATQVEARRGGLKRLCEIVLGLPLNKECQMSNWEARPLRPAQIRYAALDALCEVLIADRSQRLLERTGRRLDDFVHSLGGDKTTQLQQPSADAEAGASDIV